MPGHSGNTVRPRPRMFQALGDSQPPDRILIDGNFFRQTNLFKHDSWAATALFEKEDCPDQRIVCKFHRQQSIGLLPVRWAGRLMARREARMIRRLADVPLIPRLAGTVQDPHGRPLPHAVARGFIPGHPLSRGEAVDHRFLPTFRAVLDQIHQHGMAYVDLHKRENIIVGEADGAPYLVDFQISLILPKRGPLGALLLVFQRSDDYHLAKHWAAHRPDQCGFTTADLQHQIPWWIKAHRLIARPFREGRRRLLVALRIRNGRGRVESEYLPEDAVLNERLVRDTAPKPIN